MFFELNSAKMIAQQVMLTLLLMMMLMVMLMVMLMMLLMLMAAAAKTTCYDVFFQLQDTTEQSVSMRQLRSKVTRHCKIQARRELSQQQQHKTTTAATINPSINSIPAPPPPLLLSPCPRMHSLSSASHPQVRELTSLTNRLLAEAAPSASSSTRQESVSSAADGSLVAPDAADASAACKDVGVQAGGGWSGWTRDRRDR